MNDLIFTPKLLAFVLSELYEIDALVDAAAGDGDLVHWASGIFPNAIGIERARSRYRAARDRFEGTKDAQMFMGEAAVRLPAVLEKQVGKGRALVILDTSDPDTLHAQIDAVTAAGMQHLLLAASSPLPHRATLQAFRRATLPRCVVWLGDCVAAMDDREASALVKLARDARDGRWTPPALPAAPELKKGEGENAPAGEGEKTAENKKSKQSK